MLSGLHARLCHTFLVNPGGGTARWYLPDISFTLINRVIYVRDAVSCQNS